MFGGNIVHAASISYNVTVPVVSDYETSSIPASSDSYAQNTVNTINGKLSCWVETSSGVNCTSKVSYINTGNVKMYYSSNKSTNVKLNISTASTEWNSVSTSGVFYS